MAVLAVAGAGALAGGAIGGWSLTAIQAGYMVGSLVGGLLFAPDQGQVSGPRISDLSVQTSTYGVAKPVLYGTMRMAGNVIWAKPIQEKSFTEGGGKGKKGGGPAVTTYEYYGQFAVSFCVGPAQAIRRIWANGELVLDHSESSIDGKPYKYSEAIYHIHLGDEEQLPDPLIEADKGVGKTPAYRGTVYAVFDMLPLKQYGNRFPKIEAEIVQVRADSYISNSIDLPAQGISTWSRDNWSSDLQRPYVWDASGQDFIKVNRISGQVLLTRSIADEDVKNAFRKVFPGYSSSAMPTIVGRPIVDQQTGNVWISLNVSSTGCLMEFDGEGGALLACVRTAFNEIPDFGTVFPALNKSYLFAGGRTSSKVMIYDVEALRASVDGSIPEEGSLPGIPARQIITLPGTAVGCFTFDLTGRRVWATSYKEASSDPQTWLTAFSVGDGLIDHAIHSINAVDPSLASVAARYAVYDASTDALVFAGNDLDADRSRVFRIDPDLLSLDGELPEDVFGGGYNDTLFQNMPTAAGSVVLLGGGNITRIDTRTMKIERSWPVAAFGDGDFDLQGAWYDPLIGAVWTSSEGYSRMYLDRSKGEKINLGTVVADICGSVGLEPSDVDVSELTEDIVGFVIAKTMTARAAIEVLQRGYYFDVVEVDDKLAFKKRERLPIYTVPQAETAVSVNTGGDAPSNPILEVKQQEVELPRRVVVQYIDPEADYQPMTQTAERIQATTKSENSLVIELAIAMDADTAAKIASMALTSAWVERTSIEFELPPKYLDVVPTDVVSVEKSTGGSTAVLPTRLTEVEVGAGFRIKAKGLLSDPVIFRVDNIVGVPWGGDKAAGIPFEAPTKAFLINLPCTSIEDNDGGAFAAFAPEYSGENVRWRGAVLFEAPEGGQYQPVAASQVSVAWGKSLSVPEAAPRWGTWDDTSVVIIKMLTNDELEAVTDIDVLNGGNLFLLGKEIIQAVNVEVIDKATYKLTRLIRGRLGTEWAMDSHVTGEDFIVLQKSRMTRFGSVETRGQQKLYRAVTLGQDPSIAKTLSFANDSGGLRPYAPVHLEAVRDEAGTIDVSWVRRTRFRGDMVDQIDVPLNEVVEKYAVDVIGPDGDTLRTAYVFSPSYSYKSFMYDVDVGFTGIVSLPVLNSGFESGTLGAWEIEAGSFEVWRSYTSDIGNVGPFSGDFFGHGGASSTNAISQTVYLPSAVYMEKIEAGEALVTLKSQVMATSAGDTGTLSVRFLDGPGSVISTVESPSIQPEEIGVWTEAVLADIPVPANAVSVSIRLIAKRGSGSLANTAFDSVICEMSGVRPRVSFEISQMSDSVGRGYKSRIQA